MVKASDVAPPAQVIVGSDNRSHIVDMFGSPWCEAELEELYDEAQDVDCMTCIELFEEEEREKQG